MSIATLLPTLRGEMFKMRVPARDTKVYKDECVYSFDSPFSDGGLFVNTLNFQGVGQRYLDIDTLKTGCKIYLHELWKQVPKVVEETESMQAPNKLAIGVDGGFLNSGKYDVVKEHSVVIFHQGQRVTIPFPNRELPEHISNILQAIIDHEGMKSAMEVNTWEADNVKIISKYADNIKQINPTNRRIPQDPKQWKDEACDATENLWLNLSTGYIGGGRRNWDGTGGSGSALQHYIDTGKQYPLVVKLGTITPHGADVWSYAGDEDCLVIDPHLAEHLSFWGINIMNLEKTDKSVSEMEVSFNMSYDWSKIMEGQDELELVSGPGLIGLRNIGSSCYLNSWMQCFLSIPEVQERYFTKHDQIVQTAPNYPTNDFMTQLSKLAHALISKHYVAPVPETVDTSNTTSLGELSGDVSTLEKYVIAPRMFKQVVGHGHPEFSSGRQQDVSEFITYFLTQLQKQERTELNRLVDPSDMTTTAPSSTANIFEFHTETKFKTCHSNEVKFAKTGNQTLFNMLELPVPQDQAIKLAGTTSLHDEGKSEDINQESKRIRLEEEEKTLIPFEACLQAWLAPELVTVEHPVLKTNVPFMKTLRFQTFPRYLIVKLGRYYVGPDWRQYKINAEVPMPEKLDLTSFQGEGVHPDEILLQDTTSSSSTSANAPTPSGNGSSGNPVIPDEELVGQLVMMGFSENGSKRAAIATFNADVETAMNWVLEHMEDADFNDPPVVASTTVPAPSSTTTSAKPSVNEESLLMLTSMGYTTEQCTAALLATDHNIERAADWLFSHMDDLDADVARILGEADNNTNTAATSSGSATASTTSVDTGVGKYSLFAIISHIGKNTEHGHYVCHILKEGNWILFNDEKVGKSTKPPLGHGFLYLYRRDDGPGHL